MADPAGIPVVVVASGGIAVTQVSTKDAQVMTPIGDGGVAITLVASGGIPANLVNEDGSAYVPS